MRRADLLALRDKYERILVLRTLHARASEDPTFQEPDPKPELAALASAFPGALRELDELPLGTICARIEALVRAEAGGEPEAWMEAQHLVHRLARGALAAKGWLGKRRAITSAHRDAFLEAVDAGDLPSEAAAWADDLAHVARPPRGRLMDLVFARAAAALGVGVARARALATCPSGSRSSTKPRE
jgi:hypothetical protein